MIDKPNQQKTSKISVITTKEIFHHGPDKIPFNLVRSKRRKTSELIIENENEITIRVPFDKPIEEIKEIIHKKIQWILKKQDEYKRTKSEIKEFSYLPSSTLPYLGENHAIKINVVEDKKGNDTLELKDEKLLFILYNTDIDKEVLTKEKVKTLYENWLKKQAETIFRNKVETFSKQVKVKPKKMVLKKLKNRWGSVTKKGTINLNINLMKTPENVIDYIILHELCHFRIKGHSFKFWNFLKQFVPDYDKKVEWLSVNGRNILY